jgi:hypothetical protein
MTHNKGITSLDVPHDHMTSWSRIQVIVLACPRECKKMRKCENMQLAR